MTKTLFLTCLLAFVLSAAHAMAQQPRPPMNNFHGTLRPEAGGAPAQGIMPEGYQHAQTHQGAMPQTSMPQAAAPQASVVVVPPGPAPEYVLGVGDRIRIVVYNEPDMSGEFEVDSTGRVAMPLIGVLPAAGGTNRQLEQNIRALLSQGYLKDPRVNVEVLNYRPFFILGEVMKPNSYPYVNGMSVMSAVAIAGGYTYRGDKDKISIKRGNNKFRASETDSVLPGDIIEIEERFF